MSPMTDTRRRAQLLAGAAAALALVAGGAVFATRGSAPAPEPQPPVSGGGGFAMCAEMYDLETLAGREFAFDGTVTAVDDDRITFDVNEWFRGDDASSITLQGALSLSGLTSAGEAVPLEPGSRLLVAGDDTFVWGCGFTQPFDAAVADAWRAALS